MIVLAGGQASRLGSKEPKGTIKLGANIGKLDSLFFIQALQIKYLKKKAQEAFPGSKPSICWYLFLIFLNLIFYRLIMCSNSTLEATKEHFKKIKEITNIEEKDVIFFVQNEIPCFNMNSKYFMKNKYSISNAPGIFFQFLKILF